MCDDNIWMIMESKHHRLSLEIVLVNDELIEEISTVMTSVRTILVKIN